MTAALHLRTPARAAATCSEVIVLTDNGQCVAIAATIVEQLDILLQPLRKRCCRQ